MFKFSNRCSVGVRIIINGRLNPWDAPCDKFEHGEAKFFSMTNKEKRKY